MSEDSEVYVHTVQGAGRLIPSGGRWTSIEIDYSILPTSMKSYDSIPSIYSKSIDFDLRITDRTHFKRFLFAALALFLLIVGLILLFIFLPRKHSVPLPSNNLPLAIKHALLFFDAQKSGNITDSPLKFRGDSGMDDGQFGTTKADLVGGFYDSGNNVKFSFPAAYTVTLLSWSVIEYHGKYEAMDELEHVKDVIKWGSDYLLKLFVASNSTSVPPLLYSQVGSANTSSNAENDITCWERPEDMSYSRPVSRCFHSATDLAGELAAAMAASSLVFTDNKAYSMKLLQSSENLFELAKADTKKGTYTLDQACGGEARSLYNSSGYEDELVWAATWLFFATGNKEYLDYAEENFDSAVTEESASEHGVFYWNNKLPAIVVLLTRLRYLIDPGYPYETLLRSCSDMAITLMCSYFSAPEKYSMTPAGLILMEPNSSTPLQFAANTAFLTKLYSDYLQTMNVQGGPCDDQFYSLDSLKSFSKSQVHYILGDNPMKMSYVVGVGDRFPRQVHHRGASIPWDGKRRGCGEGKQWLDADSDNPNVLVGAMVGGPDLNDKFVDRRTQPEYTEPSIAGNSGLVAAMVALLELPDAGGVDPHRIFANIS